MSEKIAYVDPKGQIWEMPASATNAEQAKRLGWVQASDDQIASYDAGKAAATKAQAQKAADESYAGQAKTLAQGAAAGTLSVVPGIAKTAGAGYAKVTGQENPFESMPGGRESLDVLYGAGANALAGKDELAAREESRQGQARLAAANPLTAAGGYMAGQVAGGAALGLGGAARAVGGSVARGLGGVAGRLAGAAASGAVEGAPLNAGLNYDEAYLDGRRVTGDQALASAGIGALLGGGLSFAAKGAGEVFGAAGRGLAARLGGAAGEAAETAADTAPSATFEDKVRKSLKTDDASLARAGKAVLGEDVGPGFADDVRAAKRGQDLGAARTELHETATAKVAESVNESQKAVANLTAKVDSRAWKLDKVSDNLALSGHAEDAVERTATLSSSIRSDVQDAMAAIREDIHPGTGKAAEPPKVLSSLLKQIEKHDNIISETADPGRAYIAMDEIRRDLLSVSKTFQTMAKRTTDVDAEPLFHSLADKLGSHYDNSLKFLMDQETWGAQGLAQKEVNQARVSLINAEKHALPYLANETGTEYLGAGRTRPTYEANEGTILSSLKKFGTTEGAYAERRLNQYVSATQNFADAMQKYGISGEDQAAIRQLQEHSTALQKTLADTSARVKALDQAEVFTAAFKDTAQSDGKMAALLGHAVAGNAGGAVAYGLNTAYNLAQRAQNPLERIAMEEMALRTQKIIGKSLDVLLSPATGSMAAKSLEKAGQIAGSAAKGVRAAAIPTALQYFQGKHESPEAAYHKRVEELYTATTNNAGQVRDKIADSFGPLYSHDPAAVQQMTMTATNGVNFLMQQVPAGLYDPNTLQPHSNRPNPSRYEIDKFASLYTAVMKPMDVIREIPRGTVTRDQMQAIGAVYPKLYSYIRETAMMKIADLDMKGQKLPLRTTLLLDSVLDLNGAGERTFQPDFAAKYGPGMKDAPEEPAPTGGSNGRPGKTRLGKSVETGTASMLGGSA